MYPLNTFSLNNRSKVRRMAIAFLLLMLSPIVVSQSRFEPVRINCGGPKFIDPRTNFTWGADTYFTNGKQFSVCSDPRVVISNTTSTMRTLYCSNRFNTATMKYNIPVLKTIESYMVRLHFAELVCVRSDLITFTL
jgi:Malectin domain